MILDPLDIPDELLEAQEQGRLVVFVGAGVSRGSPSDLPDFNGLAADVAKGTQFETELSRHQQRLDRYFGEMARGGVNIQRLVRKRISNPASSPTDLHRWIVELFPDPKDIRIVTTNFDQHFSTILTERGLKCDQHFAPALPLGRSFKGVVYLHGCLLREEDPLILSDEDFGCAYMTDGWARNFLWGMFDTYTTLFIGYSHSDPPVEYLARGMSAIGIARRYALVGNGDEASWNSLKVTPITFEKPGGSSDFSELGRGLHAWAQFCRDQPTDTAKKVRDIVRSPPEMRPAKSQSSLLVRCLGRKDECHFFTNEATGWHWVEWANEQGLLKLLFDVEAQKLSEPSRQLAWWLAKILIYEPTDKGFLLVAQHGGSVGQDLWLFLYHNLWTDGKIDFTLPTFQKWLLLLATSCPDKHKAQLGHLLQAATKAAPRSLGLMLFRLLTATRFTVSHGWKLDISGEPDSFSTRPKAEFDLALVGESYHLEEAWRSVFKPQISMLGREYLRILNDRIQEMHGILRAAERADQRHDPWCMKGSIRERDVYRGDHDPSLVVSFLLDVVDEMSARSGGLPPLLIDEWLSADCPTLVRIGLLSLHQSTSYSNQQKVQMLVERGLIYVLAYGANFEIYEILTTCYSDLAAGDRLGLWRSIVDGPKHTAPKDSSTDAWAEYCQIQIDELTAWLGTRNRECSIASDALQRLKKRRPGFQEDEIESRAIVTSGIMEGPRSPKTSGDLLAQSVDVQIDYLLSYKGGETPLEATREGLVAAVGDACGQNAQWAISLFEELDKRHAWSSDLWEGAFWRLRLSSVPSEKLTWLLTVFESHFAGSPSLQGLSFFLFNGVEFSEEKAPTEETLLAMIRVSVKIWQQIQVDGPKQINDFENAEWTNLAINHPAGHVVEFWLKCWSFLRPRSAEPSSGWPDWMRAPLEQMVEGESYAAQLGRVILGNQLPYIHAIDAAWARSRLFPKFTFDQTGDEAFLLWEPHLTYGRLSRDLIIEMLPLYQKAFPRFRTVRSNLATHLYRHVAIILYSCLVDINKDGWLSVFLVGLSTEQRASWANQMEFVLRHFPTDRKQVIWDKWLRDYWRGRLDGKPCILESDEAGEMLECALSLDPVFTSAVELVLQGPPVSNRIGGVLFHLERGTLIQTQPGAVLRLLRWLVKNPEQDWSSGEDIRKVLMGLPKKKVFVPDLIDICQKLAGLGYTESVEMKTEITTTFIQE